MSQHQLGIYGTRYWDSEPLYLTTEQGVRVWDRVKNRWLNWESMVAKATAEGHTWQPREVGIPSLMWQLANFRGQYYAPGLDDTEALASEIVVNGEVFTGAAGATPPTSWTITGTPSFQLFGDVVNISGDPVLGGGMEQVLTGTPGEYYVIEVLNLIDTTSGVSFVIDGLALPIGPGPIDDDNDGGASEVLAASFMMPASGSVTVGIVCAGGALASISHIRVFLESELTGNPGAIGGGGPGPVNPIEPDVTGPHSGGGASWFIRKSDCMVGFDLDGNGTPDDWHTGEDVCGSSLNDEAKVAISASLIDNGCEGLMCVSAKGKLSKAYTHENLNPPVKAEDNSDASEK